MAYNLVANRSIGAINKGDEISDQILVAEILSDERFYSAVKIPQPSSGPLPVAAFSISLTSACVGTAFALTDQSTDATSWLWDFGNGTTSTEQNPTITYSEAGDWTITLTVSNLSGSDSVSHNISTVITDGFTGWYSAQGFLNGNGGVMGNSYWHKYIIGDVTATGYIDRPIDNMSITVTGPSHDIPSGEATFVFLTIHVDISGTWSFNWDYSCQDTTPDDIAGYIHGGNESSPVTYQLASNTQQRKGSISANVSAGDLIGFYVYSISCDSTPGILTITCFQAPQGA